MAAVAGGRITAGVGANLIGQHAADRNQDATVYVGGLDPQVLRAASSATPRCLLGPVRVRQRFIASVSTSPLPLQMSEELVWELFVQAGPVGKQGRAVITASSVLSLCHFQLSFVSVSCSLSVCQCSQCLLAQGSCNKYASAVWVCGVSRRGRCRLCELLCLQLELDRTLSFKSAHIRHSTPAAKLFTPQILVLIRKSYLVGILNIAGYQGIKHDQALWQSHTCEQSITRQGHP